MRTWRCVVLSLILGTVAWGSPRDESEVDSTVLANVPQTSGAAQPSEKSQPSTGATETGATPSPVGATVVLVVGAPGTQEYADEFSQWADLWEAAAERNEIRLVTIGRDEGEFADRDALEKAIANLVRIDSGDAPVWIVLIGHGTYARNVAKFNLRGRDVSATELAQWLAPLDREVVLVACASASGPFINRLSGEKRVIVTATRSGTEQNYSRFGKFFAAAVSSLEADLDHDDEVSVQEAFLKASAEVKLFYESETRISTEHALLDDNGDGRGTPAKMFRGTRPIAVAKEGKSLDGKRAARITLAPSDRSLTLTPKQRDARANIEAEMDRLRDRKATLSEVEYFDQLEPWLLKLAKIYREAEESAELETSESPSPATD